MSLIFRRLIFYFLLFIFIILAPIIVAYTAGYRFSPTQRQIVKTGALSITTLPAGAEITLNGRSGLAYTPTLITNLLPGAYEIKITKAGYHPWMKNLTVEDGKTTFAHNVSLFKLADPESTPTVNDLTSDQAVPESLGNFKVWYDDNFRKIVVTNNLLKQRVAELDADQARWRRQPTPLLFAYSGHEVWQYNPENQSTALITRLTEDIHSVIPLPREEAILIIIASESSGAEKYTIRASELDSRDHQNSWDLGKFDAIKKAVLAEDGKTLEVSGIYRGKAGRWQLQLK
ncbi:PEGA domain-containing protein [Candidatus Uhrbacteria bacterium]|nr:PEGA domain-containing protein [Candidatus Uhrbacteria bacterium]